MAKMRALTCLGKDRPLSAVHLSDQTPAIFVGSIHIATAISDGGMAVAHSLEGGQSLAGVVGYIL